MHRVALAALLASGIASAQCPSSGTTNPGLPKGENRLNAVSGIVTTSLGGNLDAGFGMTALASPDDFASGGAGIPATSNLTYVAYVDQNAMGDLTIDVRASVDGGNNWNPAVTAYTVNTAGGEDLDTGGQHLHLAARGRNEVYVLFFTNVDDITGGGQGLYVVGSQTQGQTFGPPLRVDPMQGAGGTKFDFDNPHFEVSASGLHVVYEYDAPGISCCESVSYARINFVPGMADTLQVDIGPVDVTPYLPNAFDADEPDVAADGQIVHVTWQDNSLGTFEIFSVTSCDGGATFSAPFNHTTPVGSTSNFMTQAAVDRGMVYTFYEGRPAGVAGLDKVVLDRATLDCTNPAAPALTWTQGGIVSTTVVTANADVDNFAAEVEDGVVAVLERNDSQGGANANWPYLVTDHQGGNLILTGGSFPTTNVQTVGMGGYADGHFDEGRVDVSNNVVAAAMIKNLAGATDGVTLAASADRGLTVSITDVMTQDGQNAAPGTVIRDVDNPRMAVNQDGNINIVYNDDDGSGNLCQDVYTTGDKFPRCTDDTLGSGTILVSDLDPLDAGDYAFVLATAAADPPGPNPYFPLNNAEGVQVADFVPDVFTTITLVNALSLGGFVDSQGNATLTLNGGPIPNPRALLGMPFEGAVITVDFNTLLLDKSCAKFSF